MEFPAVLGVFLMSGLTIGTNLLHVNIGGFATKGWVFKRVVLADVLSHHLVCVCEMKSPHWSMLADL